MPESALRPPREGDSRGGDLPARRWRAPLAQAFSRVCWNDEYLLYNPGTGQTHVLNQMSIDIIEMLAGESLDSHQVQRRMIEAWAVEREQREAFALRIDEHLHQLCYLGLIGDERFDDRLLLAG